MPTIEEICRFLNELAPLDLAEDWDNVGLLVGDPAGSGQRIMTCLTITPDSADEAVAEGADLIVTHHPLPFRPLKRLTTDQVPSRLLWQLVGAGVAIYSPHTAFDSAAAGINQRLAEGLELSDIQPLEPIENDPDNLGSGRVGRLPEATPLTELAQRLKAFLAIDGLHLVGKPNQTAQKVAVGCGSAGQFISAARRVGCDLLVTGETTFHTCLEAEATNIGLLLPGHYASERFAVERLAEEMAEEFTELTIWASCKEADPLVWV